MASQVNGFISNGVKGINESITEQLRRTSGDLDGEAHGTGDLETVDRTDFRGIIEPVEFSCEFEQLWWTSGDLDGEAHGTGDLEIMEWTGFRGTKEPVEYSYSSDEEVFYGNLRKRTVAMPDEEGMAAMLSGESVSSRLAGSTGPTSGSSQLPVFLSYQHKSKEQVRAIKKALESVGLSCWMDESSMRLGEKLTQKIETGIRDCKVFISCVTKDYCVSEMCKSEASLARECKKHIIPLVFEEIKPWPPKGLGITFTDLLYLNVPGGNLDSLTFQKLSGDILKFVKPSS